MPRLEGLYSMVTSVDSKGGRIMRCCSTLKLILFVERCFRRTSWPVGLSIFTVACAVRPSSHSIRGSSSGCAPSAIRSRSYQNSPTTSLKNTAVPRFLAGSSGLKTSSYVAVSFGASTNSDSPSSPSPLRATSKTTTSSRGLTSWMSTATAWRTTQVSESFCCGFGGSVISSTVYHVKWPVETSRNMMQPVTFPACSGWNVSSYSPWPRPSTWTDEGPEMWTRSLSTSKVAVWAE
mmetsp:Transcript_51348/g.135683  ORF Transcript_51348/g.135683 Transcript_51348/m.135683 type:complete len:235 (+) Transcript_51348:358-1062(+)